jgi:hypothetical protein
VSRFFLEVAVNRGLEVDVPEVRRCASGLAGAGALVAAGSGGMPESVPGWVTGEAAAAAGEAAGQRLTVVGAEIAAAARQIIAAVVDYEAADERTATRLRSLR